MSTTLSLKDSLDDLAHELAVTRRTLERIPDDKLTWKPHERSMTVGGLGQHVANLVYWMTTVVAAEEYDLATGPSALGEPGSRDEILQKFDRHVAELLEKLSVTDDAALSQVWMLRHGDQILMKQPRLNALRSACISHLAHHRGQLSVYLRLLDIPVPAIYGPSADER
jgi:uncharacterized damage-inducible protein DinB